MKTPTLFVLLSTLISCQYQPEDSDLKQLLELNHNQREAHLLGDAELLTEQMADSIELIQDGVINKVSKAQVQKQFHAYFKTVHYKKWDDLKEPRIVLSKDHSLATMSVEKIIESANVIGNSIGTYRENQWAWLAIFQKIERDWKLTGMSSGYAR